MELILTLTKGSKGTDCCHCNAEIKIPSKNVSPYIGCTTCGAHSREEHAQLHRN